MLNGVGGTPDQEGQANVFSFNLIRGKAEGVKVEGGEVILDLNQIRPHAPQSTAYSPQSFLTKNLPSAIRPSQLWANRFSYGRQEQTELRTAQWTFGGFKIDGSDQAASHLGEMINHRLGLLQPGTDQLRLQASFEGFEIYNWKSGEWERLTGQEEARVELNQLRFDLKADYIDGQGELNIRRKENKAAVVEVDDTLIDQKGLEIEMQDVGVATLKNLDTGEIVSFRLDADGNLEQLNEAITDNKEKIYTVVNREAVTLKSEEASYQVRAGVGGDWAVEETGLRSGSSREYFTRQVQHGRDVVNVVNVDTGEVTCFRLGCLVQQDEADMSGDDVITYRVHRGDVVHIDSAADWDDYKVTAGAGGDWKVEAESKGERKWTAAYWAEGLDEEDVINVKDVNSGKITSLQLGEEGSLIKLDRPVLDGEDVASYDLRPGDVVRLIGEGQRRGGHISSQVSYTLTMDVDGSLQINQGQRSAPVGVVRPDRQPRLDGEGHYQLRAETREVKRQVESAEGQKEVDIFSTGLRMTIIKPGRNSSISESWDISQDRFMVNTPAYRFDGLSITVEYLKNEHSLVSSLITKDKGRGKDNSAIIKLGGPLNSYIVKRAENV
ncbi:MAG: hypothetical protein AB1797_11245 [bacterium]